MRCGFETIGNATVVCYDEVPILSTDPWIQGSAYYGSWCLSYEIPEKQRAAILESKFIWFSHGHPDHLNPECLPLFKDKKILLPAHRGQRIYQDLKTQGFDVTILPDGKWYPLSPKIQVLCSSDSNQDATLFIGINHRLVINSNDAPDLGRDYLARKLGKKFKYSLLLSISGYPGEADFGNYYDEAGQFLPPIDFSRLEPIGLAIAQKSQRFGAKYYVPTSSFHTYQRSDAQWVRRYASSLTEFAKGFQSETSQLLPAFISYDCEQDTYEEIRPKLVEPKIYPPEFFSDSWEEPLKKGDSDELDRYFKRFERLKGVVDTVRFRVGGSEHEVKVGAGNGRGLMLVAPRNSLMNAIQYEIFDDVMIGNFVQCHLIGSWPETKLYPDFIPYVTKYGDNGRAYTNEELKEYFTFYKKRSRFGWWSYIENEITPFLVNSLGNDSITRRIAKRFYQGLKRIAGAQSA